MNGQVNESSFFLILISNSLVAEWLLVGNHLTRIYLIIWVLWAYDRVDVADIEWRRHDVLPFGKLIKIDSSLQRRLRLLVYIWISPVVLHAVSKIDFGNCHLVLILVLLLLVFFAWLEAHGACCHENVDLVVIHCLDLFFQNALLQWLISLLPGGLLFFHQVFIAVIDFEALELIPCCVFGRSWAHRWQVLLVILIGMRTAVWSWLATRIRQIRRHLSIGYWLFSLLYLLLICLILHIIFPLLVLNSLYLSNTFITLSLPWRGTTTPKISLFRNRRHLTETIPIILLAIPSQRDCWVPLFLLLSHSLFFSLNFFELLPHGFPLQFHLALMLLLQLSLERLFLLLHSLVGQRQFLAAVVVCLGARSLLWESKSFGGWWWWRLGTSRVVSAAFLWCLEGFDGGDGSWGLVATIGCLILNYHSGKLECIRILSREVCDLIWLILLAPRCLLRIAWLNCFVAWLYAGTDTITHGPSATVPELRSPLKSQSRRLIWLLWLQCYHVIVSNILDGVLILFLGCRWRSVICHLFYNIVLGVLWCRKELRCSR